MDGEDTFVTADDSQGFADSSESQPQTVETTPTGQQVPLSDVERIVNEKLQAERTRWQADSAELRMLAQSTEAKAYNRAMKTLAPKLTAIKEMQSDEGWSDAEVAQRQQREITRVFSQEAMAQGQAAQAPSIPQYSPQTATNAVAVDEILQHMQANYGVADPSIAQKYAGRDRNDTSWLESYYDDAAGARTRQASLRKREQEQRQAAQTAAQVKQGFGTTGTLSPGQPSNAQEAEARIKFLMNQQDVTPAQELSNWQEIDSLEKKLRASGQWKDEAYQW